jgi:hypothetical protein
VNLSLPPIAAAAAFNSSTSQFAHANFPFKNLASLLAAQTMNEAGRLAIKNTVSMSPDISSLCKYTQLTIIKRKINPSLSRLSTHPRLDNARLDIQHKHLRILMV